MSKVENQHLRETSKRSTNDVQEPILFLFKKKLRQMQKEKRKASLYEGYSENNKLKNSAEKLKGLKIELFKIRTSLSSTSLGNYFQSLNTDSQPRPRSGISSNECSPRTLKEKMGSLQEKLKQAKQYMTITNIREISYKNYSKQSDTTCFESKQSVESVENEVAKPRLARYSSMKQMPSNLRETRSNPYLSKDHRYYVSQLKSSFGEKFSVSSEHLKQSMQMLLQYKLIKMSLQKQKQEPLITLPRKDHGKKTLFLDLDETIIHCFETEVKDADIKISITLEGNNYKVSFNIRPYAITFLKKMKKRWEIVIFTASHRQYADTILDLLDPDGTLIDYRLYRHHCRQLTSDLFVKDLSRINRDLSEVVLVDNSCYSYAMQLDNGIPILPFYEGKDFQLRGLQAYLNALSQCEDVRVVNRNYFKLHQYASFDDCRELITQLYCNNSP